MATERPPGATGIRWWIPGYSQCFTVIDQNAGMCGMPAPGSFLFDAAMTGGAGCSCDAHAHIRAARRHLS